MELTQRKRHMYYHVPSLSSTNGASFFLFSLSAFSTSILLHSKITSPSKSVAKAQLSNTVTTLWAIHKHEPPSHVLPSCVLVRWRRWRHGHTDCHCRRFRFRRRILLSFPGSKGDFFFSLFHLNLKSIYIVGLFWFWI